MDESHLINSDQYAKRLTLRIVDYGGKKILISKLRGSTEAQDKYTKLNCEGIGRVRNFSGFRFQAELEDDIENRRTKAMLISGYNARTNVIRTQVFQVAGCSWRCWYCYVDEKILTGDPRFGRWCSCDDLLDLYELDADRPEIIDLSGGQPDLVPEWPIWMLQALAARPYGKDVFVRSEDNLTGPSISNTLTQAQTKVLRESDKYTRIGCFKGYDEESFSFNTKSVASNFENQFRCAADIIRNKIQFFAYVTFGGAPAAGVGRAMGRFLDRLQEVHRNLPLRVVPLHITPASAWNMRNQIGELQAEQEATAEWVKQMKKRFSVSDRQQKITEVSLL